MSFRLKSDVKPLTQEREQQLFKTYRNGTQAEVDSVVNELLMSNLKLIYKVAHEFKSSPLPFEDLVSEGCSGLLHAIPKFDPDKGMRFITYAVWWIRQRMRKAIEVQGRLVRVPAKTHATKAGILRLQAEMKEELGYTPDIDQLAEAAGKPVSYVKGLLNSLGQGVSIDGEEEEDSASSSEKHKLALTEDLCDVLDGKDVMEVLDSIWPQLTERDRHLLSLRFGLKDGKPKSLEEVAQEIGKCRERCRQLQEDALWALRVAIKKLN